MVAIVVTELGTETLLVRRSFVVIIVSFSLGHGQTFKTLAYIRTPDL